MDKVQKYNLFNTKTPSSESYRSYLTRSVASQRVFIVVVVVVVVVVYFVIDSVRKLLDSPSYSYIIKISNLGF
jgi:hypothetical protein